MDIAIKGMHCDACEKTIKRALEKEGVRVDSISYKKGRAAITGDISNERINTVLKSRGYSLDTGEKRARKVMNTERSIIINGILTLAALLLIQAAMAVFLYRSMPDYSSKYFLPLLYVPVAVVTNVIALWHQRAYSGNVSCMTGMMIGMTIGMTSGFSIGAIVGLTNGMFTGALVGTLVGIGAGAYAGRCCGMMGVMEGMMAGLMSGTMGAMLTVMMVLDRVEIFLPILIAVTIIILAGLMRVVYDEQGTSETKPWPLWMVFGLSLIATIGISMIIMLAEKGFY